MNVLTTATIAVALVEGVCAVKTHHDSRDGGGRATPGAVAENK